MSETRDALDADPRHRWSFLASIRVLDGARDHPRSACGQRFFHRGRRFCAKAVRPSIMSSLSSSSSTASVGWVTAARVSAMPWVSSMTCSEIRTEVGDEERTSCASARAPSSAVPADTTRLTQAVRQRLVGGEPAAGEDHLVGQLGRHRPRQPDQAACVGDQADANLGQGELRGLVGDDQMAGQRNLGAAAHGEAVDGGDDRLGQRASTGQPAEAVGGHPHRHAAGRRQQVVGGGERLSPAPVRIATHRSGSAKKASKTWSSSLLAGGVSALPCSGRVIGLCQACGRTSTLPMSFG